MLVEDQPRVGVRELKAKLSEYLSQVKEGTRVIVTERGQPIAQLAPLERPQGSDHLRALIESGEVRWSGQRLPPMHPISMAPGGKTAAQMVSDGREDRF